MSTTREERLADPEMQGGPITVGSLTFRSTTDCWGEPKWRAGDWLVGKFAEGQWWSRPVWDTEGMSGVTATSREEAMQRCAGSQVPIDRLARWDQYMREHEPPGGIEDVKRS